MRLLVALAAILIVPVVSAEYVEVNGFYKLINPTLKVDKYTNPGYSNPRTVVKGFRSATEIKERVPYNVVKTRGSVTGTNVGSSVIFRSIGGSKRYKREPGVNYGLHGAVPLRKNSRSVYALS